MTDIINKVILIILVFLLLVVGPLVNNYNVDRMIAKNEILYEVTQFIDKVRDSGNVSSEDLDELYLKCNSYGIPVDVVVKRLIPGILPDGSTEYYAVRDEDALRSFNPGDVVQVDLHEIGSSGARALTKFLTSSDIGKYELTLAGTVG